MNQLDKLFINDAHLDPFRPIYEINLFDGAGDLIDIFFTNSIEVAYEGFSMAPDYAYSCKLYLQTVESRKLVVSFYQGMERGVAV